MIRGTPMNAMPRPAQSELYAGLLPVEPSVEPAPIRPTTLENNGSKSKQPSLRKRASRALYRFLITFSMGAGATLAWQSYGDTAREMIANAYPQLGWLAPQAEPVAQSAQETIALAASDVDSQQFAASLDLDALRQSITNIAAGIAAIQEQMARSADRIANEQIAHGVAQLAAGQAQMTHEIIKLQAVEQYVLYKSAEPATRPAPVQARNQVARQAQAR
jgi:hypothetical protein